MSDIYRVQIPYPSHKFSFCAEARRLLAAGTVNREDQIEFARGDQVSMKGTVAWFADRTVKDRGDTGTPTFMKWQPDRRGSPLDSD